MKLRKYCFSCLCIILFFGIAKNLMAQPFTVNVSVTNQPENHIVFGSVRGDDFSPIDSSFLYPQSGNVIFEFPPDATPGVYRIVLGKTAYAKIMDEPPQQINFIFNNENLVFKTDYKQPEAELKVIESVENAIWFDFLSKVKILKWTIKRLEQEANFLWERGDSAKAISRANEYNSLQMERDLMIKETAAKHEAMLVSKFVANERLPILDGYLTPHERKESFKKDFFKGLDFSDERLINSSAYSDKIFDYLVSYNHPDLSKQQRENEYIKAVDIIFSNVNTNENVYRFILEYIVNGFATLQLDNVISYISKNYNYHHQ